MYVYVYVYVYAHVYVYVYVWLCVTIQNKPAVWVATPREAGWILVNWDDYSQYMGKYKMFQTTNQIIMYHWFEGPADIWLHFS